jgi:hypothetical protein
MYKAVSMLVLFGEEHESILVQFQGEVNLHSFFIVCLHVWHVRCSYLEGIADIL